MPEEVIVEPDRLGGYAADVRRKLSQVDLDAYSRAINVYLTADNDFSTWGVADLTSPAAQSMDDVERLNRAAEAFVRAMALLDGTYRFGGAARTNMSQTTFQDMVQDWEAMEVEAVAVQAVPPPARPVLGRVEPGGEHWGDEMFLPDGDDLRNPLWWSDGVTTGVSTGARLVDERLLVDVAGHSRNTPSGRVTTVRAHQRWQPGTASAMNRVGSASKWAKAVRSPVVLVGGRVAPFALAGADQFLDDMDDPTLTDTEVAVRTSGAVLVEGGTAAVGAWAGAKGGAVLGAAIGSFIPGVGTAIGGVVGGIIGGVAGGIVGGELGDWAHGKADHFWEASAGFVDDIGDGLSDVADDVGGHIDDVGDFFGELF